MAYKRIEIDDGFGPLKTAVRSLFPDTVPKTGVFCLCGVDRSLYLSLWLSQNGIIRLTEINLTSRKVVRGRSYTPELKNPDSKADLAIMCLLPNDPTSIMSRTVARFVDRATHSIDVIAWFEPYLELRKLIS